MWNFDEKSAEKVSQVSDLFSAEIPIGNSKNKIAFMIVSQVDQDFADKIT